MEIKLGDKLRELREDLDLNQTQLGKELNMTQRKISYIECGKYEPSVEDIIAFCHFFKIYANYLLGLPNNYKEKPEVLCCSIYILSLPS